METRVRGVVQLDDGKVLVLASNLGRHDELVVGINASIHGRVERAICSGNANLNFYNLGFILTICFTCQKTYFVSELQDP